MNISIISVHNLQKIFATIAVLAMVFSPFANVPFASAVGGKPTYSIVGNTPTVNALSITWSGTATGGPVAGQVADHGICIDWDEDQDSTTHNWVNAPSFSLTPGTDSFTATWGGSHAFPSSGTYTIFARVHHASCQGAESSDATTQATVIIPPTPTTGTLTVIKQVTNDNGGAKVIADFPLFVNGNSVTSGAQNTLTAGTFTVTETADAGYTGTFSGDCNASGVVVLAAGQNKTCTITNDDKPANLTINKVLAGGGPANANQWTLSAAGTTPLSGTTPVTGQVSAGTYTITETGAVPLYTQTGIVCTGGALSGNQLTVTNGTSVTCTITNTYTPTSATLTVFKDFGALFGASFPVTDFSFSVDNTTQAFQVGGSVLSLLGNVAHTISEVNLPFGFAAPQYSADCLGGVATVAIGGSETCTITNTGIQPKLTLLKKVLNDDAGVALDTAFTLTATGPTAGVTGIEGATSVTNAGVNVGAYTISETGPTSGYNASYACVKNGGATTTANTITLALGDVAACTIINDDKDPTAAQVGFTKAIVGGYSLPDQLPSAFSFNVVGGTVSTTVAHAGSLELGVGTYSITEVGPKAGYTTTFSEACANGTLTIASGDLGGSLSCTITNTELSQCNDGIDNDRDGFIDFGTGAGNDVGCSVGSDDSETDSAPACTVAVVSDTTNTVTEKAGAFAQVLSYVHPAWTAVITGTEQWIWGDNPVVDTTVATTQTFVKSFNWNGPVTSALLDIASDNSYVVKLNGNVVTNSGVDSNFSAALQDNNVDVTAGNIITGTNTLEIAVLNEATPNDSNPRNNPAGLLYRLDVTGNNQVDCTTVPTPGRYTLDITITGDGEGHVLGDAEDISCYSEGESISCSHTYPAGTVVDLSAIAEAGSNFDNSWTVGAGTCTGNNTPCQVTMNSDIPLTAHFDLNDQGGSSRGGSSSGSRRKPTTTNQPAGQVLGAAMSTLPVGAPNTGAGGTSPVNPELPTTFAVLSARTVLKKSK